MNAVQDLQLIQGLEEAQGGVFTTADLRACLADRHPAARARRVQRLVRAGVLTRFTRGFYVTERFDLELLSARIAPRSTVSFERVLAAGLVIGPDPGRRVTATKVGPARRYAARGLEIEHLSASPAQEFGYTVERGVRRADLEKAILDLLYYHLRGRRSVVDIHSDLDLDKLDRSRLEQYVARYRNPRFRAFAANVLELR